MITEQQKEYLRNKFQNCGKSAKQIAQEIEVSESTFSRAKNSDFANLSMHKLDLLITALGGSMQEFFQICSNSEREFLSENNSLTTFLEHYVIQQRLIVEEEIEVLRNQNRRLIVGLICSLLLFIVFLLLDSLNGTYGWLRY